MAIQYEKSCGAVVFTRLNGERRYVIIRSLEGYYGFPKGHMEAGETEEQTALREIWEEVGIRPWLYPEFREEIVYLLPQTQIRKQVVYFLAEFDGQTIKPQKEELRSAPLVTFQEAMDLLTHAQAQAILQAANDYLNAREERK